MLSEISPISKRSVAVFCIKLSWALGGMFQTLVSKIVLRKHGHKYLVSLAKNAYSFISIVLMNLDHKLTLSKNDKYENRGKVQHPLVVTSCFHPITPVLHHGDANDSFPDANSPPQRVSPVAPCQRTLFSSSWDPEVCLIDIFILIELMSVLMT